MQSDYDCEMCGKKVDNKNDLNNLNNRLTNIIKSFSTHIKNTIKNKYKSSGFKYMNIHEKELSIHISPNISTPVIDTTQEPR